MAKWEMVRLGDVCIKIDTENPADYIREIIYYDISSVDSDSRRITSCNRISSADAPSRARRKVFCGDILVSTVRPNLNAVAVVEDESNDLIASTGFCVLRPDNKRINMRYLFQFLQTPTFVLAVTRQATGASYPAVTNRIVFDQRIPLPPLQVQGRIADVLDRASVLIEKRKEQIDKLDLLVKAQFIEMFGDPVTNPNGWETVNLGDSCFINPKKKEIEGLAGDTQSSLVGMADVSETGKINTSHPTTIAESSKGLTYFGENDVLFAKITPCMENGKGAIARGLYSGIGFGSTEFHVLRPIKGISNSEWLFYLTYLDSFRKQAELNMTGSAGQKRVPVKYIEAYRVPLPSISLQNRFAHFIHRVEAQRALFQQSLAKLELNYKALMQKCFWGEIF